MAKYYYEKWSIKTEYEYQEYLHTSGIETNRTIQGAFKRKKVSDSYEIRDNEFYATGEIAATKVTTSVGVVGKNIFSDVPNITSWYDFPNIDSVTGYLYRYLITQRITISGTDGLMLAYDVYALKEIVSSQSPLNLIETLVAEDGTYPDNGAQGDYWYIKTKKAISSQIKIDGVVKDIVSYELKGYGAVSLQFKDDKGIIHDI